MRFTALLVILTGLVGQKAPVQAPKRNPPPKFHILRVDGSVGMVSVVVPKTTTDEGLRTLLWFFREKHAAGKLSEIGLKPATFAKGGGIFVYREARYANEQWESYAKGDHDVAVYQWGIGGNPRNVSGSLTTKTGESIVVFEGLLP